MTDPPLPLADIFPRFGEADWRDRVKAATGRAPATSSGRGDDGIVVRPIYARDPVAHPVQGRPGGTRWRIVHRIDSAASQAMAVQTAEALSAGAEGVALVFQTSLHPLPGGLPVSDAGRLADLLGARLAGGSTVDLDAGEATMQVAAAFLDHAQRLGWRLRLSFDPMATRAARGQWDRPLHETAASIVDTVRLLDRNGMDGCAAIADGRLWHAGGASQAQELAAVLATVVWFLRLFDTSRLPAEASAARIGVTLTADADQFLTIAKFRAIRLLIDRVFEIVGITGGRPAVHAESAWRMMGSDPYVNLLRATAATFSAAVGGADSAAVLPFDIAPSPHGLPRRLTDNLQTILAEEAHLFRVGDPGAGSGAVEALTAALAERAWHRFQQIERAGGIASDAAMASLCGDIAVTRDARGGGSGSAPTHKDVDRARPALVFVRADGAAR